MSKTRIHIMRFVLALLLFQFFAPALLLKNDRPATPDKITCISDAQQRSPIIPILLKEKEETESRSDDLFADLAPIIDFTDHRFILAGFHTARPASFPDHQYDHSPPLFMLHGALLI